MEDVAEDPNHEFDAQSDEINGNGLPRIINVGIPGPGARPFLWRRSWRDKVGLNCEESENDHLQRHETCQSDYGL